MRGLVERVPEDALDRRTPCAGYMLGDLLDHVSGFARGLYAAAKKDAGSPPEPADASHLGADWRTRIPKELDALVDAWRDPAAREGMTGAGGIELPGEVAAVV